MGEDKYPGPRYERTLSLACEEGNHHACRPLANPDDAECDCPCHSDWD